jgi:hypothetical protein
MIAPEHGFVLFVLLLAGLLGLSVYNLFSTSRDLQRVCELIGPHDVTVANPITPRQEIDNICINHPPDNAF